MSPIQRRTGDFDDSEEKRLSRLAKLRIGMRHWVLWFVDRSLAWPLAVAAFALCIGGLIHHSNTQRIALRDSLLCVEDSSDIDRDLAHERLQFLKEYLLQQQMINTEHLLARQDLRMQARIFYATILAGLLAAILIAGDRESRKTDLLFVAMVLTSIMMYGIDVHVVDLDARYSISSDLVNNTISDLMHVSRDATYWYELKDSRPLLREAADFYDAADWEARLCHKLRRLIRPNLEQCVFYMVPLMLVGWGRKWWVQSPVRGFKSAVKQR